MGFTSILDVEEQFLTPAMRQYRDAKAANPDCIILLRMGDFYELFYEDAVTAAKELEITLTARGKNEKRAPLAGVPYHSIEGYIGKLVAKGYKVAIVEQLEDPKQAKGVVKRGLVRIITPGTVIEDSLLEDKENSYLTSLAAHGDSFAAAFCDVSTGEFFVTSFEGMRELEGLLSRYRPRECVLALSLKVNTELIDLLTRHECHISSQRDESFAISRARSCLLDHFEIPSLESYGLEGHELSIRCCGALLAYLQETQLNALSHVRGIRYIRGGGVMELDLATQRNLELLRNTKDNTSEHTLLWVLDKTVTAMGGRLLKSWIRSPLLVAEAIEKRYDAVDYFFSQVLLREEIREILKGVYDIERLVTRISYGSLTPRDLYVLAKSISLVSLLQEKLSDADALLLREFCSLDALSELSAFLLGALREDAPTSSKDGKILQTGFSEEVDALRKLAFESKALLQEIEEREKESTGISTLRIKYNRVFGYFIEVSRRQSENVPASYIRKQTTANSERYVTQELNELENKILNAQEELTKKEYALFVELVEKTQQHLAQIQQLARGIGVIDVTNAFSRVASEYNYVRPALTSKQELMLVGSRHPIVERLVRDFISNDVTLHEGELMLITGPNMAGKSTVMRQSALIILMAQIGCFVPAREAVIGLVDRIFTRVGAQDHLAGGQSTFMVEMQETANILHNATERSFVILDEIGRGTSTFDGVAVAWSVGEYLYNNIKCRCMFSTHYHILSSLADDLERVTCYTIAVNEVGGEIVFLRKLIRGKTDKSYGVHVAEIAGLPKQAITRAREIQRMLEDDDEMHKRVQVKKIEDQKSLGEY